MYYLSGQINIRKDLIEKELNRGNTQASDFKQLKLTKKFISWLFRHYAVHEFTIHFYDEEPEYEYDEENDTVPYSPMDWYKLWRDYEQRRMTFNNWIDVYGPGIWGLSDKENEDIVKDCLISVRDWPVKKKDRIYWAKNEDSIWIYCYGRDFLGEDYWFIMRRKQDEGICPYCGERQWFKYDRERDGYFEIEEPECVKHICNFCLG